MKIRIGTRGSKLALIQTNLVISEIIKHYKNADCEIVEIITSGDKITDKNLYDIGGKALFLKEIEEQLLDKKIDIAVHSLKDVPGMLPKGLEISAVLEREDPRDCFVSFKSNSILTLPQNAKIGSSSVRRTIIINQVRPDIEIAAFRGNINTRLEKLKNGQVDGTILAVAGLKRAGLFDDKCCFPIEADFMLPAVGQGIIGIEVRQDDQNMLELCKQINHKPTWDLSIAERSFLTYLDASCKTPMAAYARYENDKILASYMLANEDGSKISGCNKIFPATEACEQGVKAAIELLKYISS